MLIIFWRAYFQVDLADTHDRPVYEDLSDTSAKLHRVAHLVCCKIPAQVDLAPSKFYY